jgi:hypothetical protein
MMADLLMSTTSVSKTVLSTAGILGVASVYNGRVMSTLDGPLVSGRPIVNPNAVRVDDSFSPRGTPFRS